MHKEPGRLRIGVPMYGGDGAKPVEGTDRTTVSTEVHTNTHAARLHAVGDCPQRLRLSPRRDPEAMFRPRHAPVSSIDVRVAAAAVPAAASDEAHGTAGM
eukprot:604010-Prymnesium_polylepis.1